ncbi:methyltransferase domain-containing protein [Patescibacteria group bacterium]|nr:methyltransferase domain-containing protein [Patescibacteria group bacterium]MBU2633237.1 methyltransferase domain-containing protein [Patescibacteria group bacterium]
MFLNPSRVVELLDVRSGMKVADFGCGSGHFTVEMAKRVGGDGIVYAFDVQKEALGALKSRSALENISNIEYRRVDLEIEGSSLLADNLVDIVLISNVLFQVEDKKSFAKEAFRVLKSGGCVIFIDWNPSADKLGPPQNMRIGEDEARVLFTGVGLVEDRGFKAGDSHYGLVFKKP